MKLNEIRDNSGATQYKTRVGRGIGCTKGKTCGRGHKGALARTGVSNQGEGGQTRLFQRIPKRGFNKPNRQCVEAVNIFAIERAVEAKKLDAAKINSESLQKAGLTKGRGLVKILGTGEVKSKLNIDADLASKGAADAVAKAGGKISLPAPAKEAA
jgi:large subunit ribosomal protein L15